jgi:lauroyl/myristoyl acyltransferase
VSPVWLAISSGAPLLPLVTHRGGAGPARHVTEIGPPLDLPRELPRQQAFEAGAALIASFLTDKLGRYPADWHFWDHFEPGRFLEPSAQEAP